MKTLTSITYVQDLARNQRMERTVSFIRPRHASKPTWTGAARMVAAKLNEENDTAIRPSSISVSRIEHCSYATR